MAASQVTLFDNNAQALRLERARCRQQQGLPFLAERVIEDLAERLMDVNRTFERVCLVGPFDWRDAVRASLSQQEKIGQFDWSETPPAKDFAKSGYDLLISLVHLQSLNHVGGWMQAVRAALVPDGLFLACLIGGNSLTELRQALYRIDTDRLGSPTPRIHPMIDVRAAAQLLAHAGLAIPVTDSDRFTVHYREIPTLVGDLRDLGMTNSLSDRAKRTTPTLLKDMEAQLRPAGRELIAMTWEIVWMIGWAPHDSQQKPLKRGSAKVGLNEALKQIRDNNPSKGAL